MTRGVRLSVALLLLFGGVARAEPGDADDWALSRPGAAGARSRAESGGSQVGIAQVERAAVRGDRALLERTVARYLAGAADRARAEVMVARVLGAHDLVHEALAHGERACEIAPRSREARRVLAQLLERARRLEEASVAWEAVLAASEEAGETGEASEARQHLVSVWARSGVLGERTVALERRLVEEPADSRAARLLIELLARDPKREGQALALLEQLARERGEGLDVLRRTAALRARVGPANEALARFERLLAQREASCDDVADALAIAVVHPEAEAARGIALRAGERCGVEARVQRAIAAVWRARGEDGAARVAAERALALDPDDWETRLVLADDAAKRGERAEAVARLRALVLRARDEAGIVAGASRLRVLEPRVLEVVLMARTRDPAVGRVAVRLALEHYRESLLAEHDEETTERAPGRAREVVVRIVPVLRLALVSEQARVRGLALDLLEAAPVSEVARSLWALVAREDALASERARAATVLGRLRLAGMGARLRRLEVPPALRPVIASAIAASEGSAGGRPVALVEQGNCAEWEPSGLLGQGGAVDLAKVGAALRGPDWRLRAAVLDALAALGAVPPGLVPVLAELLVSAPDWPTRMRAARALAGEASVAVRDDEPVGLVRAALATPRVRGGGRCVPVSRGLAN